MTDLDGQATIFVTGGAGYVGSHCSVELLNAGYNIVVVDNFINAVPGKNGSMPECLQRVEEITKKKITFYEADLQDKKAIEDIFDKHKIDCVIHFAALKGVGESVQIPLEYYSNNVGGTVNLMEIMKRKGVRKFIFSSSATVYGEPKYLPLDEKHPTGGTCSSPYGRTKYFIEEILKDICQSEKGWKMMLLRYFNPVGAHRSGRIGEDPQGMPNNLMPFISQVAVGRRPELQVFGNDFKTKDGTGLRDYIHVVDLAQGHVSALNSLFKSSFFGFKIYNLGTGQGFTVLEVIQAFKEASGVDVPYRIVGRRSGDVDAMYADVLLAEKELGWKSTYNINDMCLDTWRWQTQNPNGYRLT